MLPDGFIRSCAGTGWGPVRALTPFRCRYVSRLNGALGRSPANRQTICRPERQE
jgi:hypothetical protein